MDKKNPDELRENILQNPCPKNQRWAILIPHTMKKTEITQLLNNTQVSVHEIDPGIISVMYVDEVKGFEFEKVFIFKNDMTENELYTAATRALGKLVLVS